jgi:putative ABC transport system substrate-binding protein
VLDRRTFLRALSGGLLAAPLAAEGQPAGKTYRIGFLGDVAPPTNPLPNFRSGLNNLGYVEGRDFVMEYRWTADPDRLPELAARTPSPHWSAWATCTTPPPRPTV